ncbi:hypothetical protein H6P81_015283 [Aristolochia fimbriata]|uniref:Methyltransferase type 11 domain-containing protein n=1 Tax=Aristolochia fimbriata TaxID=158543 RepID=A0AAV7E9M2_ARIFI|nr:hypothetical protein H6P81_015283 [Aristolochia fimbriata]
MESHSRSRNLFFLFLLLATNLLTFFFFSSSTSSFDTFASISEDDRVAVSTPHSLPSEFVAATEPQPLPFGYNSNFDSDTIHPPVGHACTLFPSDLKRYMSYTVGGPCPDDDLLAQKLLLKGCEPLPRRRCRPRSPANFADPHPLPAALWTTPSDTSVLWSHYSCKNYTCLINRKYQKHFDDCKDCFDLDGREKTRWVTPGGALDFTVDQVLSLKKPGTIRIGVDIGGGSGTFAVRMRERGATIVTTSMNFNGPFNSFIASRGVIPLYISVSQRLPFFDNTLDIVHSMHVLSNWIPTQMLGFILFDIYRVLRPGGLFWLDHFFCVEDQMVEVYVPLIESVGFQKLKWVVGQKLDRGAHLKEMYISAVLEKPVKKQR